jgi:hypothetical protein
MAYFRLKDRENGSAALHAALKIDPNLSEAGAAKVALQTSF